MIAFVTVSIIALLYGISPSEVDPGFRTSGRDR
jgi:hypothetical protein